MMLTRNRLVILFFSVVVVTSSVVLAQFVRAQEGGVMGSGPSLISVQGAIPIDGFWVEFAHYGRDSFAVGCWPADQAGNDCEPSSGGNSVLGSAPPWTFVAPSQGATLTVTDAFNRGEMFEVYDFDISIGTTSVVGAGGNCGNNPDVCLLDPQVSHGIFSLESGPHAISIKVAASPFDGGAAYFRVVPAEPKTEPLCKETGFMRDGINLTARLIDPTSVSGEVDATGCNIGVYYGPESAGQIENSAIYGANYFGIVNDGATVNVLSSEIHDIGENPFNGTQHGVAIYYTNGGDGTLDGNTIYGYQKGGIVVDLTGTRGIVTNNTVIGLGPVDFIAQNGIQVSRGATGEVRGNTISGNFYTGTVGVGPNPGGQNPPGWEYTSAGLLLYQPGDVKHSMNKYSGNQKNVSVVP